MTEGDASGRVFTFPVIPTFSVCPARGYLAGEQPACPTCGRPCEVWTRVVGYHRPVSSFDVGKQGEHAASSRRWSRDFPRVGDDPFQSV